MWFPFLFFIAKPNMRKSFSLAFFFFPYYFSETKCSLSASWTVYGISMGFSCVKKAQCDGDSSSNEKN